MTHIDVFMEDGSAEIEFCLEDVTNETLWTFIIEMEGLNTSQGLGLRNVKATASDSVTYKTHTTSLWKGTLIPEEDDEDEDDEDDFGRGIFFMLSSLIL